MGSACQSVIMALKRHKILFICSIFVGIVVIYGVETGDSYFGSSEDQCSGDNCDKPKTEETLNTQTVATPSDKEIDIIITFANAVNNYNLKKQFTQTVSSLLHHASPSLNIHIIGEEASQKVAADIIKNNAGEAKYKMINLDIDKLARDLDDVVKPMQQQFSYKPGAYFNHALFFLSIAIHRVMPETMHKVIMLDADLKFTDDIQKLYDRFDLFTDENIMGIGREMQPVYRHAFWEYRNKNPGTRVGEPAPNGLTGFNSGVLLLHLDNMRKSELYNSFLTSEAVAEISKEFYFKGHLGDQDFFTLLNMKHEQLFHVLPCHWNRQLCTWWRDHGYQDIFPLYHNCEGDIKIWHGNCKTPIP